MHLFPMVNKQDEQTWVEVSLEVEGELAEPVANTLAEYVSHGVVMEQVVSEGDGDEDRDPPVRIYGYIPVGPRLEERKSSIERALWHLSQIESLPSPTFKPLEAEDWRTVWQKRYHPISLGERLIVVPSWMSSPDDTREPIYISPGLAFGSGTHPSTQLSLAMIDDVLSSAGKRPGAMMDVGCGSGILAIAAVKLGVPSVLAVDNDPEAVRVARANTFENKAHPQIEVALGSVPEIREGRFGMRQAPLVCANIIAPVLRQLFEEGLASTVELGGELILSGMLEGQAGDMLDLLADHGFSVVSRQQKNDWVALRGAKGPS